MTLSRIDSGFERMEPISQNSWVIQSKVELVDKHWIVSVCYGLKSIKYFVSSYFLNTKIKPKTATNTAYNAPIIFVDAFYVFGGYDNGGQGKLNAIGRLDNNNRWSQAGNLASARYGHGVVFIDGYFLVVGGYGNYQTERCSLQEGAVSCTRQAPSLNNYFEYPELFMVSESFCHTWMK